MTVSTDLTKLIYDGNDSTTVFPFTFKIFLKSDITVVLTGATGIETILAEGIDYSVDGEGDAAGGEVTYPISGDPIVPLATGDKLTLWRVPGILQGTILANQSGFHPKTIEDMVDLTTMISQYINERLDRALYIPVSFEGLNPALPEPIALGFPRINAALTAMEWAIAADLSDVTTFGAGFVYAGGDLSLAKPVLDCIAGGTADALTGATSPAMTALSNNLHVVVEALYSNATTTPTFDLEGLGAKTIVKGADVALKVGDIPGANAKLSLVYDATLGKWVLLNPALMEDAAGKAEVQSGEYVYAEATGSVNVMVAAYSPTILALTEGMRITVKVNLANTITNPTVNVDTLGNKTIIHEDGSALSIGELTVDFYADLRYNGTAFELLNPQEMPIGISGESRNLIIFDASTTTIDIDADEILLVDTNGRAKVVTAVNLTNDNSGTGVDGLDTGVIGDYTSSWIYVWIISNGITTGSLLSASLTAPTMPTGYTFKAMVGTVRVNPIDDYVGFRQEGKRLDFDQAWTIKASSFTAGAWTSVDVSGFFPPIARVVRYAVSQAAAASDANTGMSPYSDGAAGFYIKGRVSLGTMDFDGLFAVAGYSVHCGEIRYAATSYYWWAGTTGCLLALGCDIY